MEQSFWAARWSEDRIGFHQAEVNVHLRDHWPGLGLDRETPVLVPLCGKTKDMLWLRSLGHPVVGVEFVPQAVDSFFAEAGIPSMERQNHGAMCRMSTDGGPTLTLLCGDFLRLPPRAIGPVGAFYDRAALVAVPPSSRSHYGQRLAQLLAPPCRGLLISFEYPTDQREGPPFSVDSAGISEALHPGLSARQIERNLLDTDHEDRFGVSWVADAVYSVEASTRDSR